MNTPTARTGTSYRFPFLNIRNITGPDETEYKTYVGLSPISSIVDISIEENVRGYILEGQERRTPTTVHKAIRGSLDDNPDIFHLLHSGVTIVARETELRDKDKFIELVNPSIINGAQTQGVVQEYFHAIDKECKKAEARGEAPPDRVMPMIRFEIVVTDDQEVIDDISIARNMQNDVLKISIANKKGHLEELGRAFESYHPSLKLQTNEAERPSDKNNIVPTEKLLQVIAALVPKQLLLNKANSSKTYTYSQKTRCLTEFVDLKTKAENEEHKDHERAKELYKFYLDICGEAWTTYLEWQGTNIPYLRERAVKRQEDGRIIVADGIVFPILAALSYFTEETPDGWKIDVPDNQPFVNLVVSTASTAFTQLANHQPHLMGRSRACYDMIEGNIKNMLEYHKAVSA